MAKKKNNFYAVKKGKNIGVYKTWEECKEQVDGFSGALYKGFKTKRDAENYLSGGKDDKGPSLEEAEITIYVDGSFDEGTGIYGYGCVVIQKDGKIQKFYGAGNNNESAKLRNVAGEMLAAMYAVRFAINNGYKSINICYDYNGLEMWANGEWKTNNVLTTKYANAMKEWSDEISILFQKVAAHTGVGYNEMADQLAKYAVSNFNNTIKEN